LHSNVEKLFIDRLFGSLQGQSALGKLSFEHLDAIIRWTERRLGVPMHRFASFRLTHLFF
jgi:hypothetical protein